MSFNVHFSQDRKVQNCPGTGPFESDHCYIGGEGAAGGQPVGDKAYCGVACDETPLLGYPGGAIAQVDLSGDGEFDIEQTFNCSVIPNE